MKKVLTLLLFMWLSTGLIAQSLPTFKVVESILKEIPAGMPLEEFQVLRPNAKATDTEGFRTILEENFNSKGVKNITYYFDNEGDKPYYECIIEFDNEITRESASTRLLGPPNHPTEKNHWVVYKGDGDYPAVAWAFDEKLVFAAELPSTEWEGDGMFKFPANFKDVDLRVCKEVVKKAEQDTPTNDNKEGSITCVQYAQEIAKLFQSGVHFTLPEDSIKVIYPKASKLPESFDFKNEYILTLAQNGVKNVTFVFDKEDKKPLYELIFEFEDVDSTRRLAEMIFGKPNHPKLDDHWVATGDVEGAITMIWLFDNKMVVAVNIPKSEFEGDENFVEPPGGMVDKDEDNVHPDNNENATVLMNHFIDDATNDFADLKGEALPNKKDEFNSSMAYIGAEQTLIRKSTAGKWRLEARFPNYSDMETAKAEFEKQLEAIQNLEGLEYRLVKKSDLETKNGRTYIWDVQTMDDQSLGIILKLQMYPASGQQFGLKLELGK